MAADRAAANAHAGEPWRNAQEVFMFWSGRQAGHRRGSAWESAFPPCWVPRRARALSLHPSSTHLLCCRVAIARWLRCDPPCAFSISITVPCTPVGGWGSDSDRECSAIGGGLLRRVKDRIIFASGERPEHHSGTACPVRPGRSDGNAKLIAFTLQARSIRVKGPERFRRSLPVHSALAPSPQLHATAHRDGRAHPME